MRPPIRSVLLLTAGNSIHSQRWARALSGRGLRVLVVSQQDFMAGEWGERSELIRLPWRGQLGYLANALRLRRLVREHAPDVVNVHYATGYGICALVSGVRPYVLSVWGADVYDFPEKSPLHRAVLRRSLRAAARIASTSRVMARRVQDLLEEEIDVCLTPFGVDSSHFRPGPGPREAGDLVVGTVKTLASKYGIDVLLRAYALLARDPAVLGAAAPYSVSLRIVGGGPEEAHLRALAAELGLDPDMVFAGPVPHHQVPQILNALDVFVAASRLDSESFGVAVVEASSCGVPVVVSDAGGLPEVVRNGVTGVVVPREDPHSLYLALRALILDPEARERMGRAGVELVKAEYEWESCVEALLACYGGARAEHEGRVAARRRRPG